VLLAEDNAVSQKVALEVLRRLGHHADVVDDGREVVAALERDCYDVVLMDLQMPGMDGLAVTRQVCERWPPDRRPRIVALSASELPEDRVQWLAAGADGWIGKALPVDDLRRELAGAAPRRSAAAPAAVPAVENVVENLRRLETRGTPGFADEVLDAFLRDAADQLATLRVAVARRDAGSVERAAHGLKGNASMVGAASLARTCEELIGLARAGSLDAGEPVVRRLDAAIGAIRRSAPSQSRAAGSPGDGPKVVE
jgi:CheY-like chemotaxis protein